MELWTLYIIIAFVAFSSMYAFYRMRKRLFQAYEADKDKLKRILYVLNDNAAIGKNSKSIISSAKRIQEVFLSLKTSTFTDYSIEKGGDDFMFSLSNALSLKYIELKSSTNLIQGLVENLEDEDFSSLIDYYYEEFEQRDDTSEELKNIVTDFSNAMRGKVDDDVFIEKMKHIHAKLAGYIEYPSPTINDIIDKSIAKLYLNEEFEQKISDKKINRESISRMAKTLSELSIEAEKLENIKRELDESNKIFGRLPEILTGRGGGLIGGTFGTKLGAVIGTVLFPGVGTIVGGIGGGVGGALVGGFGDIFSTSINSKYTKEEKQQLVKVIRKYIYVTEKTIIRLEDDIRKLSRLLNRETKIIQKKYIDEISFDLIKFSQFVLDKKWVINEVKNEIELESDNMYEKFFFLKNRSKEKKIEGLLNSIIDNIISNYSYVGKNVVSGILRDSSQIETFKASISKQNKIHSLLLLLSVFYNVENYKNHLYESLNVQFKVAEILEKNFNEISSDFIRVQSELQVQKEKITKKSLS